MKITTIFKREFIIEELKATTKEAVLAELASVFPRDGMSGDLSAIVKILMDREKLGSTGIGDGIAIPHGKILGLDNLLVSFGRSNRGVAFDALDGRPAFLFFLLMAPENSASQHLQALAKISRMLKDGVFRQRLMEAESQDELYNVIAEKDEQS